MEIFRSEIKVGFVILTSFVLLALGIFLVSDIRTLWEEKKTLVLLFPYADGITKGAPVWYSGLEVGEVSGVRIVHDEVDRIAVTVRIDPEARVKEDSKAYIRNLGMMGSKYVEISPGSPQAPELPDGGTLEGQTPSSLSEFIETGKVIAVQLQETLGEVRNLVADLRTRLPLERTFDNANAFLAEMRARAEQLKGVLEKVDLMVTDTHRSVMGISQSIRAGVKDLRSTARASEKELTALLKDLRQTNEQLRKSLAKVEKAALPVLSQARSGLEEAEGLLGDARSVINDNDRNIYLLLLHLKEASRHLEALSKDLRAHPWKVLWKGEGTTDGVPPTGPAEWREKGRIGWHESKQQ